MWFLILLAANSQKQNSPLDLAVCCLFVIISNSNGLIQVCAMLAVSSNFINMKIGRNCFKFTNSLVKAQIWLNTVKWCTRWHDSAVGPNILYPACHSWYWEVCVCVCKQKHPVSSYSFHFTLCTLYLHSHYTVSCTCVCTHTHTYTHVIHRHPCTVWKVYIYKVLILHAVGMQN